MLKGYHEYSLGDCGWCPLKMLSNMNARHDEVAAEEGVQTEKRTL